MRLTLFSSLCYSALRRQPLVHRAAAWRASTISAQAPLLDSPAEDDDSSSTAAALLACGRRGRWRMALDLLTQLEATGGASASAYKSVLLACRKHK